VSPFVSLSPFLPSGSAGEDKWLWPGMSCTAPGGNRPTRGEPRGGAMYAVRTRTDISLRASVRHTSPTHRSAPGAEPNGVRGIGRLQDRLVLLAWIPMQKKRPNISPDFMRYFGYNQPSFAVF
jgi:hypothetical protein